MATRYFALIIGVFYVAIGVMGFIPNLVTPTTVDAPPLLFETGYGYLLGLFPINILHNIIHLGIGIWGVAAYRDLHDARTFSRWTAILYGLLAVMGLIPLLYITFGAVPIFGNNVWLHAVTAISAGYFGFILPNLQKAKNSQEGEYPGTAS